MQFQLFMLAFGDCVIGVPSKEIIPNESQGVFFFLRDFMVTDAIFVNKFWNNFYNML